MKIQNLIVPLHLSVTALEEATKVYMELSGRQGYPDILLVSNDLASVACNINLAYGLTQRYTIIPIDQWPIGVWALTGRDAIILGDD